MVYKLPWKQPYTIYERLSVPTIRDVNEWIHDPELSNEVADIYYADIDDMFFKLVPLNSKRNTRYFHGELAWQASQRCAEDMLYMERRNGYVS